MPIGNAPPRSRWKMLVLAMLGSSLGFALLVASVISWASSLGHTMPRRGPGGPPRDRTERRMARLDREDRFVPPGGIQDDTIQGPPVFRPAVAVNITNKNAILSFKDTGKSGPGDDIFRDVVVPDLEIKISDSGEFSLRRSPRKYVQATIVDGDTVYTNVAIRLKGGPGSFRQFDDRPAFTVNFEHFGSEQKFHGLKKIHLNNSVQDRSLVAEKISRELFEAAGVPVPRAGNARVTINGREMGMYVLIEGINKQFLKRYFKDTKGNVYDGHSGTDVTDSLPVNSGDEPRDKTRLRALAAAVRERDLDTRMASLEKTLDVDRFLSFLAMEVILGHWDGYTIGRNNFRIYHDRDTDRMVFIPQGMDQVLTRPTRGIYPQANGLVARSVLEIPEARARYRERVAFLATNVFRFEAIQARVREVTQKLGASAEREAEAAKYRSGGESFCRRVRDRAVTLHQEFWPAEPVRLASIGTRMGTNQVSWIALTNWSSKIDEGDPEPKLSREKDDTGNPLLHIATTDRCTASWRTSEMLEDGRYRFEARVKTRGVVLRPEDPRDGAGLRISRFRKGQRNEGDRGWTPVTFDFQVTDGPKEIELVCELRANEGEIWYDEKSLRLRRLE